MKRIILFFTFLAPVIAAGQQAPDNDAIFRSTMDGSSPYYYPALFTRYMAGDTTLTVTDYRYLYYGYAYQNAYRPLEAGPREKDRILTLLERTREIDYDHCEQIVSLATAVMKTEPFDLSNINFLTYAYGMLGDTINEKINYDRFTKIYEAIISSGTGLKEDSPWHVLAFSHATDVLGVMGLRAQRRTVVTRTVEYVSLAERTPQAKGYYFDFGRMYWKPPETMPEKRVQGFELKGLPKKR